MIRLLALDIDGTLLDSRGQLPPANRDAIADAVERGLEVVLVTGRSFHFAQPVAALLPVPVTLIVNNGAVVKDHTGTTVMRHVLPRETALHILSATPEHEESVAIVFDRTAPDDPRQIVFERMDWTHPNRRGYFEKNRAFIASSGGPLATALAEDDPIQVMFNGGVTAMRELLATLRGLPVADRMSVAITEYVHRDFSLIDVNGPGCSKGTTLARLVASRGWTRDAVMAAGDNLNDVEMLDFAGRSYLMGNAADELKTRGYRATASNDENGLAAAIASCLGDR
jgi:Cof subfamily protein (haloacid dehalogenase superfamily)